MIDFWEILGHTATDDAFRKTMYQTFAGKKPAQNPDGDNNFACLFADADYDTVRGLVVAKMGPVSLMALGEWLVVSMLHPDSQPLLDNLGGTTQHLLAGYTSTNPLFYQTLGAAMVDSSFRDQFNANNEKAYGFNLPAADRTTLAKVIGDNTFAAQAGIFHDSTWDDSCKDMCIQWPVHPYAHALENPFQQ